MAMRVLQSIPTKTQSSDRRPGVLVEHPMRESDIMFHPKTSGMKLLMRTQGYSINMSFVESDPFVEQAMVELFGGVPPELDGYTRSGATLQGLYDGIARYDRERKGIPTGDPDFTMAVNIARAAFDPGLKVKPLSIDEVTLRSNTSAGWTWLGRTKGEVDHEIRQEAKKLSRLAKRGRLSKAALPPCVTFVRTQLATVDNPKVRPVWGVPAEIVAWEEQFIEALENVYDERDIPIPWGGKAMKALPILIDNMFLKGDAVGTDWSGYDSSVGADYIRLGYSIFKSYLDLTPEQEREYEKIVDYAIATPIVMPNGYVYLKFGGIASGMPSTQLLGSLLNYIFQLTLQLKVFKAYFKTMVLGDDSAYSVPRGTKVDLEIMAKTADALFGLTLNVKKSIVATRAEDFVFLGHGSQAGKMDREEVHLLRLALYPEREVRGPGHATARIEGLLIDSGFKSGALFNLYVYLVNKYKEVAPIDERLLTVVYGLDVDPGIKPEWEVWIHS